MNIVLTRVDNRLIHGQVMEAWVPHVKADCIVVANDDAASSPLKRAMMEACVPSNLKVMIGTIEVISRRLQAGEISASRILLLLENSQDALALYREGVTFSKLNLGNLHATKGKVAVSCTLCIDEEDVDNLQELESLGVKVTARCIPQDGEQDWHRLQQCYLKASDD
jgi:PTS system mannose-specific IIB component